MLIRDDGGRWTAITQPAHAHLAGQLAQHWAEPLASATVLGIQQHDAPWTRYDLTPPLHEGRAAAFFEAPFDERIALWMDAAEHVEAQSPYAALLVSLHATNIHTRYLPAEQRPRELLTNARADQDRLLDQLPDTTRAYAEADADLLFALDALSLTLCHGWQDRELPVLPDGTTIRFTRTGADGGTLDPWPLRPDTVTVTVPARTLTERFDDAGRLHAALRVQPFHTETYVLRRG